MELMYLREAERLLVVATGALSIFLGYRLFRAVRTGRGEAQVKLPGDVTIMATRVAPGVFFALFGALVVAVSLVYPVTYSELVRADNQGVIERRTEASGIAERSQHPSSEASPGGVTAARTHAPESARELDRLRVRRVIVLVNQMHQRIEPSLSEAQRARIGREVGNAKLHLIRPVWAEEWGPYEDFATWAESGATSGDRQASFGAAVELFRAGLGERP